MNTPTPYYVEAPAERIEVDRLELEGAIDRAASAYVNGLAPRLPPLYWQYHSGGAPASVDKELRAIVRGDDAITVLEQWGTALGLDGPIDNPDGTREWSGTLTRRLHADIFCIVDADLWKKARDA